MNSLRGLASSLSPCARKTRSMKQVVEAGWRLRDVNQTAYYAGAPIRLSPLRRTEISHPQLSVSCAHGELRAGPMGVSGFSH